MNDAQALDLVAQAFEVATRLAGPILLAALAIGVVVSVIQTLTQVQEMTLTFVPKLAAAGLIVLFAGHWMMGEMINWVRQLWELIPSLV